MWVYRRSVAELNTHLKRTFSPWCALSGRLSVKVGSSLGKNYIKYFFYCQPHIIIILYDICVLFTPVFMKNSSAVYFLPFLQFTVYSSLKMGVGTVHPQLFTIHSSLKTGVDTANPQLFTIHSSQFTIHYSLFSIHYSAYPPFFCWY